MISRQLVWHEVSSCRLSYGYQFGLHCLVRSTDTKQFITPRRVKGEIFAWIYWWRAWCLEVSPMVNGLAFYLWLGNQDYEVQILWTVLLYYSFWEQLTCKIWLKHEKKTHINTTETNHWNRKNKEATISVYYSNFFFGLHIILVLIIITPNFGLVSIIFFF